MHLVLHPKVDKVFVTGSLDAGQSILAMAGCAVRPVVLSLGGKHPAIVARDADVRRAARGIVWGALANCGQNCGAVERVFVDERCASLFMESLLAEVDKVTVGQSLEPGVDVGPLISAERRAVVHEQVMEAVSRVEPRSFAAARSPRGPGHFYPPTVVLEPPVDCRLDARGDTRAGDPRRRHLQSGAGDDAGQRHRLRTHRQRLDPFRRRRPSA